MSSRFTPAKSPRSARRAPLIALALAGVTGAAALTGSLPVLADASGDGSTLYSPAQPTAQDPGAPLRCEIALDAVYGGTEITGTVHASRPVAGQYQMAITSHSAGGHATIRQSGSFEAAPGMPALLGETRLMGSPASQDVDLTVTVEGERLTCGAADL